MYYLILIASLVANGASISVTQTEFATKSACQEALIKVLHTVNGQQDTRGNSRVKVDGVCVETGRDK